MNFKTLLPARWRNSDPTIPVVRLAGTIASGGALGRTTLNLATVASPLAKAFDEKAPAVAILVNSPGGSPVQSHLIFRRIRDLALEKKKRVHVFVEDVAASGGYMIACAGDDIHADPSSVVGSIGVISAGFGFQDAIGKLGVERRVYTAGESKSTLDPFKPADTDDVAHLGTLLVEIHDVFKTLVRDARGDRLGDDPAIFEGRFWAGQSALDRGLVDGIGDVRTVLKRLYGPKTKMKLTDVRRGIFGRRPASIAGMGGEPAEGAAAALEERAMRARYGL